VWWSDHELAAPRIDCPGALDGKRPVAVVAYDGDCVAAYLFSRSALESKHGRFTSSEPDLKVRKISPFSNPAIGPTFSDGLQDKSLGTGDAVVVDAVPLLIVTGQPTAKIRRWTLRRRRTVNEEQCRRRAEKH
jgi:hypothetical protein